MKTWLLQEGDIVLEQGNVKWVEGREELAQAVRVRLGTRLGESFFTPEMGIDHELLIGQPFDEDQMREIVLEALADEERISSVDEINIQYDKASRTADIHVAMTSIEGEEVEVDVNSSGFEA
ncbi:DUF2634 domain-containing protein [Paenibacillus arenosi]|uniref:DUF2634 domain-containing protein n=1 Tax=Paenibacillus arenosi TaxID=2774142 RepID=A0ABR9AYT7_9BACL|nr:DUF2634 domain-containing protein [Paenibacillus arenosi]MBD8498365.1 DUF2634 domain-containing protein [Paenibacillus arenosi]